MDLSRRHFLKLGSALGVSAALPACSLLKLTSKEDEYVYQLTAEPAQASLVSGLLYISSGLQQFYSGSYDTLSPGAEGDGSLHQ